MSNPENPVPTRCERCGEAMSLAGRVPKVGPHPELVTFRCDDCGHVQTLEDAAGS